MKHLLQLLLLFCFLPALNLFSGNIEQSDSILVLRGRVLGGDTNQPLPNASITVQQVKVSSVTNQDGYFSIRVPESTLNKQLIIHYLGGYENKEIPIVTLINNPNNHITLIPAPIQLSELLVVSGEGKSLIKDALQRIPPQNYSSDPNMMVAFYRESVKKKDQIISLL